MKNAFKAIILLMIIFVVLGGCSTPSTGSSDSQQQSATGQIPFEIGDPNASKTVSSNTGRPLPTYGNYAYTFWADKRAGSVSMTLDDNNGYTTTASNLRGGFVAGIGWANGISNRKIYFEKEFTSSWGGAFGFYGWTKGSSNEWDGLVEYYVIEQGGQYKNPANSEEEKNGNDHIYKGYKTIDGAPYLIYYHYREGFPCILGSGNFDQYISIRYYWWWWRDEGEIDLQDHVDAWHDFGMDLGPVHDYQVLFTEMWSKQNVNGEPLSGYYVSGSSSGYLEER